MPRSGSRPAITATESAPALNTSSCVFLRDAADGNQRLFDQRSAPAYLFDSDDGVRIELGGGGEDRAERDVIHRFAAGRAELRRRCGWRIRLPHPVPSGGAHRAAADRPARRAARPPAAWRNRRGRSPQARRRLRGRGAPRCARIRRSRGSSALCGGSAEYPRRHPETRRRRFPARYRARSSDSVSRIG